MSGHRYSHDFPGLFIKFIVDRLRRDRNELWGELTVECQLPGARIDGNGHLVTGDFNFSSVRSRQERAKLLAQRAMTHNGVDWYLLLEEFAQKVFQAERTGEPAVKLRELPLPERGDEIKIHGLVFPRRHPTIIFGDGGAAKSYTALYVAGMLARRGLKIGLFDWELCGDDHRLRYQALFGTEMPEMVFYVRCERPLTYEADRLAHIVQDNGLDYGVFDSVAFACDGPPEAAEMASRYFRGVREIGVGSLHIAHINRSENSEEKPFGSAFWHNGARTTWFVKAVADPQGDLQLGFYCKKSNLGPVWPATGFRIRFEKNRTVFDPVSSLSNPELLEKLTVRERVDKLLKDGGPMTVHKVSTALSIPADTVYKTVQRNNTVFKLLEGGWIERKS